MEKDEVNQGSEISQSQGTKRFQPADWFADSNTAKN